MGYTKHVWQTNEVITEQKLNKIETGIEEAYNKATMSAAELLGNQSELTDIIQQMITNYAFSIDEANHILKFNSR